MTLRRNDMHVGLRHVIALLLGVCGITAAAPRTVGAQASLPPNIVLFIADDLGARDIGPYGNKVVRTPNLDRLAEESIRFDAALAASPTCAPSRSTLYTGLMPFRHGAHSNHSGVREGTRSLPHYLRPLGYDVAIAGKLHVGPEEVFPFRRIANSNVREPGYEDAHFLFIDLNVDAVDAWLAQRDPAEPFLLVVADHSPHVIWPEEAAYAPDEVDVPPPHIDTPAYRRSRARYYTDVTKMDRNAGAVLASLEQHGLAQNTLFVFTADQGPQWPFGKWTLYDAGVLAPLLVRWPGTVRPGTTTEALVSLADLLPTFIEAAGGAPPTDIDGESFLPVLRGASNEHRDAVFASHTGDNTMNRSPARMVRTDRYKYILNLAPEILYTTHMDRAKDHDGGREYWDSWVRAAYTDPHAAAVLWRYHHRPAEELYDLEADPHEMRNLAAEPAYAKLVERLRGRLAEWRAGQGDAETGPENVEGGERRRAVAPYIF